jgi:hypothetical protein
MFLVGKAVQVKMAVREVMVPRGKNKNHKIKLNNLTRNV